MSTSNSIRFTLRSPCQRRPRSITDVCTSQDALEMIPPDALFQPPANTTLHCMPYPGEHDAAYTTMRYAGVQDTAIHNTSRHALSGQHDTALQCSMLESETVRYTTLHCMLCLDNKTLHALQCSMLECKTLQYTTLHCMLCLDSTALHYTALCWSARHCTTQHFTVCSSMDSTTLHYTVICWSALHCTTHHSTVCYSGEHDIVLHCSML